MSRHLKRVPLTFTWPLRQRWGGYLNPYYALATPCPDCTNGYDRVRGRPDANAALFYAQWYGDAPFDPSAYGAEPLHLSDAGIRRRALRNVEGLGEQALTQEIRRLHNLWRWQWCHHLIQADVDALVAEGRLHDLTSTWSAEHGWQKRTDGHHPTAAEVNAWSLDGTGHDSINSSICVEARCAREGVPSRCVRCQGDARIWPTPEIEQQCEDWTRTDPPTGDGYQLWEDTSEGSPISPVFTTFEELCAWAADNATTFGSFKATVEEWRAMLDGGVVHTRVGRNTFL